MSTFQKPKAKQILLWGALVIVTLLVLKRYLPMMQLPTKGRIQQLEQSLKSKQSDLAVQQKMNDDWRNNLNLIQKNSSMFWTRKKPNIPLEQEVSEEFKDILRIASVNLRRQTAKIIKNQNSQYVQEVEIEIQMADSSMKEFARLLREVAAHRRKLVWTYCKIDAENPNAPTTIKVTGRLKAYLLTEDASRILDFDATAPAPSAGSSNTISRKGASK